MLSPRQRTLRSRLGAFTLHATHDSRETTSKARAAFLARFLDQVDPDRILPEDERLRRATYARRAYFVRLARSSANKRARKHHNSEPSSGAVGR